MRIYDIIDKKRHAQRLSLEEIEFVISSYMKNEIAEKLSALAEAADSASCDVENFGGDEALDLLSLAKDIYELVA